MKGISHSVRTEVSPQSVGSVDLCAAREQPHDDGQHRRVASREVQWRSAAFVKGVDLVASEAGTQQKLQRGGDVADSYGQVER